MFWFALATQLSLPVPINLSVPDVRDVFSVGDFPADLVKAGDSKALLTRTTVRPDGTIQGCVAEVSSGDSSLDAYTCGLILRRAKFRPATWNDGSPAYGVLRVPVVWALSNEYQAVAPDLELSVNRLPDGARSPLALGVEVATDDKGRPSLCLQIPPVVHKQQFPELVSIACQQVIATVQLSPPTDASGKPVPSVQTVSVRFTVGH
jgi:hypothetical protein